MTSNSNYLTNFNNSFTDYIDIISTVSPVVFANYVNNTSTSGTLMPCRYLYLGDMLIQFSDFSNYDNSANLIPYGNSVTITFPIQYNSPPYIALLAPYIAASTGSMLNIQSLTSSTLTCYVANGGATPAFFIIGPRNLNPPPFTLTNINSAIMSATYSYSNNYYVITVINIKSPDTNSDSVSGNITFNEPISNASIICVGAGAGGGGGGNGLNSGGGGGGGNFLINNVSFNSSIYTFYVGTGGEGGVYGTNSGSGYNGGSSYLADSSNNILIECTGGKKGTTSGGGSAGTITIGGSGGSGGNGGNMSSGGGNSASYTSNFVFPTEITTIPVSYCGGGGGATTSTGGGHGNNGDGGDSGGNTSIDGKDAISYGSGGGGGSGGVAGIDEHTGNGGAGANGIIYIFFQYP